MWSLTSQRERRTSGPEDFQSSATKDFFNTIRSKADIGERPAGDHAIGGSHTPAATHRRIGDRSSGRFYSADAQIRSVERTMIREARPIDALRRN
jgi:hypothetical protein